MRMCSIVAPLALLLAWPVQASVDMTPVNPELVKEIAAPRAEMAIADISDMPAADRDADASGDAAKAPSWVVALPCVKSDNRMVC